MVGAEGHSHRGALGWRRGLTAENVARNVALDCSSSAWICSTFIHDEAAGLEDGHHFNKSPQVDFHRWVLFARGVAKDVHFLEKFELQRLDRGRGAQHHPMVTSRTHQLLDSGPPELRAALKDQRENTLTNDLRAWGVASG